MTADNNDLGPSDLLATKKSGVRYWERRRWIYIALLIPPSAIGFFLTDEVLGGFGDKRFLSSFTVLMMFAVGFINANIAYSFAYVFEFGFLGTSRYEEYSKTWRSLLFAAGCILGMILAFGASRSISFAIYTPI